MKKSWGIVGGCRKLYATKDLGARRPFLHAVVSPPGLRFGASEIDSPTHQPPVRPAAGGPDKPNQLSCARPGTRDCTGKRTSLGRHAPGGTNVRLQHGSRHHAKIGPTGCAIGSPLRPGVCRDAARKFRPRLRSRCATELRRTARSAGRCQQRQLADPRTGRQPGPARHVRAARPTARAKPGSLGRRVRGQVPDLGDPGPADDRRSPTGKDRHGRRRRTHRQPG